MTIIYLAHSGILIETANCQLFIDAIDYVDDHYDVDKEVYFFVTHGHGDHLNRTIFDYNRQGAYYVLSDDIAISGLARVTWVSPNNSYTLNDLVIQTYGSTDLGVSFVIELAGRVILHSGDLNWWHWQNDDEQTQAGEARQFKAIVDQLPKRIDLAFVPYDPRLGDAEHYSFSYYLDTKYVTHLVPIHMRTDFAVSERMMERFPHHRHKLVQVVKENQQILEW